MKTNSVTLGLYAGSFDPFHVGHLSVVNQAVRIFDEVIVAKGKNPDKKRDDSYPLPVDYLKNIHVGVRVYDTLLTELITELENEFYNVVLVRGLRNGADLEYEQNLIAFLREMNPNVKVATFYCEPQFRHVSSSTLRGIRQFSETEYKKYVVGEIK